MGKLIAAMASSHAFTFLEPQTWDKRREQARQSYKRRYGTAPADLPEVAAETQEANETRYQKIRSDLNFLRERVQSISPDLLIVLGDDQNENYSESNLPQFAIYLGKQFVAATRDGRVGERFNCDTKAAWQIYEECIEGGIDLASSTSFANDQLISHAHREPLEFLQLGDTVCVLPIFINAINVPAPTPARCYEFGRVLRKSVEKLPNQTRVAVYASGGLSHFSAGFPWKHYQGNAALGSICQDFDRQILGWMENGEGARLAQLTNRDLLAQGEIELRQWITLMGMVGAGKPERLNYEPFYRGIMGMAVGYWPLDRAGINE